MVVQDERTRKALVNLLEKQKAAIDAAEEICQCANCVQARMKKQISQCDKNKLIQHLPDEMFHTLPSNVIPELSPRYMNFKYGKNWH